MSDRLSLDDVLAMRETLGAHLTPTPLLSHPMLDEEFGRAFRILVKHENHQPTGAFKVRNGIAALSTLAPGARAQGVITATRGNHGQGVALAGRLLGVHVTVCVPHGNNPEKNAAMRALGAELIEFGDTYDDAADQAERLASERGLTMVHSTGAPGLLAGAATLSLEIVEQCPKLDAIVVAVGGGSQAVGAITVTRALAPHVRVYGVQAENAPAQHDAIKRGEPLVRRPLPTIADGLATGQSYPLTFETMRDGLTDVLLVSDAEIAEAMRMTLRTTHNLLEGAAAAPFAALRKLTAELAGKNVVVIASGGNVDQETLRRVVNREI